MEPTKTATPSMTLSGAQAIQVTSPFENVTQAESITVELPADKKERLNKIVEQTVRKNFGIDHRPRESTPAYRFDTKIVFKPDSTGKSGDVECQIDSSTSFENTTGNLVSDTDKTRLVKEILTALNNELAAYFRTIDNPENKAIVIEQHYVMIIS